MEKPNLTRYYVHNPALRLVVDRVRNAAAVLQGTLTPNAYFSGKVDYAISKDNPVLTNPWGIEAFTRQGFAGMFKKMISESFTGTTLYSSQATAIDKIASNLEFYNDPYLRPGQSINYVTGRLSDPDMHADTANRLTNALLQGQAAEAGLGQASLSSARGSSRVLSSIDEQYWGNVATKPTVSKERSSISMANEQGMAAGKSISSTENSTIKIGEIEIPPAPGLLRNYSSNSTVLGIVRTKKVIKPPAQRALS